MPTLPGFVGGTAEVRSGNQSVERSINFYTEAAPGTPKFPTRLQYTPGYKPFAVVGDGPIRALFAMDGRAWCVTGSALYELFASGDAVLRGTTAVDGNPATISSNNKGGNQLFITHGGYGYILDLTSNVVTQIGGDFLTDIAPVVMGIFSDGYFLTLTRDTNKVFYSALEDGSSWDALDFFSVSTVADPLRAIAESHREIWCFGEHTTSVWQNVGDADDPFQPIGGVKIEQGISAPFSVANFDNSLMWVGGSKDGDRVLYKARGYSPDRISSHSIEWFLNNYPRTDDAIAWTYQDEGHLFYQLHLPSPPHPNRRVEHTSLVFDAAMTQGNPWHERAVWDSTQLTWTPDVPRCHCYAFGRHLVGAYDGPAIYDMSLAYLDYTRVQLV